MRSVRRGGFQVELFINVAGMKRDQPSNCGGCGSDELWLLHNVRHRGIYRRLCTSCVLKSFPGSFCPICYEFFEGSSPSNDDVLCLKCPSISHSACVGLDVAPRYVCPPCENPSFLFFDIGGSSKTSKGCDGKSVGIDQKSGKVLLAAARIASFSMNKATATARVEMEKRAKEAALTKKRAKEALERVALLASKEKEKGVPVSAPVVEQKKMYKGNSAVAAAVAAQKRIQSHIRAEKMDISISRGVPASLNNVGLREKERWAGFQAPKIVLGPPKKGVLVEDKDKQKGSLATAAGREQVQNPTSGNEKERSSNLPSLQNLSVEVEKEKNGLFSVPPVAGQLRHPQNSHDGEDRCLEGFANTEMVPQLTHSNQGLDEYTETDEEIEDRNDSGEGEKMLGDDECSFVDPKEVERVSKVIEYLFTSDQFGINLSHDMVIDVLARIHYARLPAFRFFCWARQRLGFSHDA
ncbi:hypothetical protein HHK36_023008 [Tetracentron sinense]|uniref:Uncharacterized protein n=1 Tax=Tetracentron sinense TaxID=13715 RepID=A0A835DA58_TETSI|nr:hypothetical protein HHK36_023008 [Tetracentron sinense]